MARRLERREGDTDTVEVTLLEDGGAFDISGANTATLYAQEHGETPLALDGLPGTIVDDGTTALRGRVDFPASTAGKEIENLIAGYYDVQIVVVWPDGTERRWPNDESDRAAWIIRPRLDSE